MVNANPVSSVPVSGGIACIADKASAIGVSLYISFAMIERNRQGGCHKPEVCTESWSSGQSDIGTERVKAVVAAAKTRSTVGLGSSSIA